jgi:hypothetical protein
MTNASRLARGILCFALAAAPAAAEVAPWDQAKATALAKDLVAAVDALYDTFYKQPKPAGTPSSTRDYYRLKTDLRRIENEARGLAADLERGEGREQTLPAYEDLMVSVRWARERAQSVFTTQDVQQRASAARAILNQLAPLYDPDAPAPR